ncbi:TraB/GumN family protein [Candidatus Halobonum tyrrellensis]|uniref:Plasmid transfer protein n=1 Tax=Candidatus Halobonum tyrrellensis G22 TaxID=1324957 RepID=V4IZX2_9EURY|nr:TraB/GumN family protein [Candidatus Halobonum tyrrellensis]ESP88707.1 plasmid transfer protein [Candidatus Halobonum tyrrellensis G22]
MSFDPPGSGSTDSDPDSDSGRRPDSASGGTAAVTPDGDGEGSVRVVGTAHVSHRSVDEVRETIEEERPDVVAVELDEGRYRQMKGETPDDLDAGDLLRGNTVFQFIAYWMLSYVQARMGERFDIEPGAEMLAAVETAESLGVDVALVDRDIQTTIQRFWTRLSLVEKLRMGGALAFGVTDPRVAGVVFGVVAGLVLGPLVGLFGGAVGLTTPLLVAVGAGGVVGGAAGYLAYAAATGADTTTRLAVAAGVGLAVAAGVAGTGVGVDLLASLLSEFVLGALGSLAVGVAVGVGVGGVAAVAADALGVGFADEGEEVDEGFDPDDLTDADVVTAMMEEFRTVSPGGAEALIDERDAFIAHRLVALRESGARVVAIVGAGHRAGIESYLRSPETLPPMESLVGQAESTGVPWGKIVAYGVSVGFVGLFVLLAMAGVRNEQLLALFGAWFLVNGVLAAGLAKLAGARWSSALVGGAVAWMTSINPLLAPGWFTGYVELRHMAVNVADIGRLNALLSDETRPVSDIVSEMLDVPLFRLIVVVAMTNVGSIIASALFLLYVIPAFFSSFEAGVTQLMLDGARESARILWTTLRGLA